MRTAMSKHLTFSLLIIVGLGGYCQADTNTTKKAKIERAKKDAKLPVIKLKIDKSTPTNPNLKKGKGCEDLEEAKGEVFDDYPIAETVPCDKVDCKNLKPAVLIKNNYKELPTAKTDGSCEGDE